MMRLNEKIEEFLRFEEETNRRRTQCTAAIARAIGVPTALARKELLCMENAKIVKRYLPWCHQGMIWWERVDGSAKAANLSTVTPPRDLRTKLGDVA